MDKKLFILPVFAIIGATAGSVIASNINTDKTTAVDKPPIVLTVENHEKRLGDIETRTDNVETQVNQNTLDIATLQNSNNYQQNSNSESRVIEKVVTVVEKTPPLEEGDYPITPNDPAPEPEPVIDPNTLTDVNGYWTGKVDAGGRPTQRCVYTFYDGRVGYRTATRPINYPIDCGLQAGDVAPSTFIALIVFAPVPSQ